MWLWNFLKSILLYFTFSSDELQRENLICPLVSELTTSPDYKDLDSFFIHLMSLKQEKKVAREFNSQDVFFLDTDPKNMVYTQLVLEEGLDDDLRVMRVHKELSAHQDESTPFVTHFEVSRCVRLEKDIYLFMNDETRVNGSMQRAIAEDPRIKKDFALTALRLDFYNRILDKFRLFTYSNYKFDRLLKSQILYQVNDTGGPAALRSYDPLFDLLYWVTPLQGIRGDESGERFDLLLVAKVLLQIEFDFIFQYQPEISTNEIAKLKNQPSSKEPHQVEAGLKGFYIIPESIFSLAGFPDSCDKMPLKDRKIVQKLIVYIDMLMQLTDTLQNSQKQVAAMRDMLGFLSKVANHLFRQANQQNVFNPDHSNLHNRLLTQSSGTQPTKGLQPYIENQIVQKSKFKVDSENGKKLISLNSGNHNSEIVVDKKAPQSGVQTSEVTRTDNEDHIRIENEKNFRLLEEDTHRRFFEKILKACENDENILKTPFLEPIIEANLDMVQELERQHLANVQKVDTLLI